MSMVVVGSMIERRWNRAEEVSMIPWISVRC
jgi:hypothetical protein